MCLPIENALIFAADADEEFILKAFGTAGPRKAVALIIDSQGAEKIPEIKNQVRWMTKSFNSINLRRDFDLVLDTVRDLIQNHRDAGFEVYVSITSSFPEISAALYVATMYKGGIPIAPNAPDPELPMLRVVLLPETSLSILKVLYEEFEGIAFLKELSNRVADYLERVRGREIRRPKKEKEERKEVSFEPTVNYHVNRKLKPLGLVRTELEGKRLKIILTSSGIAIAKRADDYLKFYPEKSKREEEKKKRKKRASIIITG